MQLVFVEKKIIYFRQYTQHAIKLNNHQKKTFFRKKTLQLITMKKKKEKENE